MEGINIDFFDHAVDIEIGSVSMLQIEGLGRTMYYKYGPSEDDWYILA